MAKRLRPARFSLDANVERIFMGQAKPMGNGAHVLVPRNFTGREVFVLVPSKVRAKSGKRVEVY